MSHLATHPSGLLASGHEKLAWWLWSSATPLRCAPAFKGAQIYMPMPLLAFSPNGQTLAAGGGHARTHLWDATTGHSLPEQLEPVNDDGVHVTALTWSPDGQQVWMATGQGRILVWSFGTRKRDTNDGPLAGAVMTGIAFRPDGHEVAVTVRAPNACRIVMLDAKSRAPRFVIPVGDAAWLAIAYSPDGRLLAVSEASQVTIWDAVARAVLVRFPADPEVHTIAFTPDGTLLVASGSAGVVRAFGPPLAPKR